MALNELRKVTEAEITDATFKWGRKLAVTIEKKDRLLSNTLFLDSLAVAENFWIHWLWPKAWRYFPFRKTRPAFAK